MHKLLYAAVVLALATGSARADIINATFNFGWACDPYEYGSVTFTGNEEADGTIRLQDLSSLTLTDNVIRTIDLGNVVAFGTFNVPDMRWMNDAPDWNGKPTAWLTWANFGASLNTDDDGFVIIVNPAALTSADIPEPASLSLLAAGLCGLIASGPRRRTMANRASDQS